MVCAVFDALPLMLLGMDGPEHRIVAANAAYQAASGKHELLGRPLREAFPEILGQQVIDMFDRVYSSGVQETAREWRVQYCRDGRTEPDEEYFDFTVTPRRGVGGEVSGVSMYAILATDRVRERQAAQARAAAAERRYEQARDTITALQRQLLPPGLPVLPGVQVAASYLLADAETAAGGDWFDAVPLPGGRVALVVGDVVGHGVAASATMGQLRAVLQDHLDRTGDVLDAVEAVDRMAHRLPGARAATVCVALFDPGRGTLAYCTAGHPPPLLVTAGGQARYLAPTAGGPLGTGSAYGLRYDRLELGEVVLLYSDGIIERPGREPAAATAELARAAGDAVAERAFGRSGLPAVERACTHTLELLVRATGHADDITMLAAQRVAPPVELLLELPARLSAVREARAAVDQWLAAVGAGERDLNAVRHATGELVTNAAEHSNPDTTQGRLRVAARLDADGTAQITVADNGRWRSAARPPEPPRSPGPLDRERGRGLAMAAGLVDELRLDRDGGGTTATIRHGLSRPARLLNADELDGQAPERWHRDGPALLLVLEQPGGRIRVDGPIDALTAPQLRTELRHATQGGTRPLTVDLTGVNLLASAGVSALHEAIARNDRQGEHLLLYAPTGSPAHHVLNLVNFPHTTTDPAAGKS